MTVKDKRAPKTRIKAGTLRAALKDVIGVVESRSTIPILSTVLLRVADQQISLTVTDLDHQGVRECASDDRDGPASREWLDSIRGFAVCLQAKPLEAILAELDSEAMVTIEAPAEVADDWAGRVTLSAGKARFRVIALPVKDFPVLDHFDIECEFEIGCSQLADAFVAVDHAISSEETRYYLNGVFLHSADMDLRFAATDGSRLARWMTDGPVGTATFPAAIVSRKTVAVLEKLLAAATKAADENSSPPTVLVEANAAGSRVRFAMPAEDGGDVELVAKTIDGTFPDYNRVIPASPEHRVTVDRQALSAAVKRVAVLASAKSRAVKIEFREDLLTVSAQSPELGEAVEELACTYDGPEIAFGFDSKYLREGLGAFASDTAALQFSADPASPVRIAGWEDGGEVGALLQVLMPVKVA